MLEMTKNLILIKKTEKQIENCSLNNFNLPLTMRPILQLSALLYYSLLGQLQVFELMNLAYHGMMPMVTN